jgi:hypothetical protein
LRKSASGVVRALKVVSLNPCPLEERMIETFSLYSNLMEKQVAVFAAILAMGAGLGGYAIHEHSVARTVDRNLAAQKAQSAAELLANQKASYLAARVETASKPSPAHLLVENPRFKKLQSRFVARGEESGQSPENQADAQR